MVVKENDRVDIKELKELYERLTIEILEYKEIYYGDPPIIGSISWNSIRELEANQKLELLRIAASDCAMLKAKYNLDNIYYASNLNEQNRKKIKIIFSTGASLQKLLLKEKWDMNEADFCAFVDFCNEHFDKTTWYDAYPHDALIRRAKIVSNGLAPSEKLMISIESLRIADENCIYAEHRKLNQKINILLDGRDGLPVNKHDFLGEAILNYCNNLPEERKETWSALVRLCLAEGTKGAPTAKWLKDIEPIKIKIKEELQRCMLEWLGICENRIREIHKEDDHLFNFLRDNNIAIFKGLLWCCPTEESPQLQQAIANYVLIAYKKKPGVGPISMATGTAGLWNLSRLPVKEGIPRLLAIRNKVSNNTILKSIDKLLREASEKNNLHPQEMEEIACPDYGMKEIGLWEKDIGDYKIIIREKHYQTLLSFEKNGKPVNSAPAGLKTEFPEELKNAKTLQKNISEQIRTHTDRLENTFLHNREWTYENWKNLYLDHPLLSIMGRKIIWHFNTGSEKFEGIVHKGKMVQGDGSPLPFVNGETKVSLWHPVGFDSGYIFQWRQWLRQNEIQQPFKQAFREVYLLTDAELRTDNYSNRFAAHIIKQHQFNALAKLRGWHYNLMGQWDGHNHPIKKLPWLNMHIEWFVDADEQSQVNASSVYNFIATDQVRFYKNGSLLHLYDVPAVVFSELMRDVDLFVGVCSIGNDPDWQDGGNQTANLYWREYSFSNELSASAEIRMETLQHLIPRMKIAQQCSFDKRFLIVKGNLRTYKIHMGSGNILMEPNDQYLCIVPDSRPSGTEKNLFIPFEGDRMLSIIISKALLLAADEKITDTTITRQIR
jgi:hypothetical protein